MEDDKTLFNHVKMALRISTDALNIEIQGIIDACKADLALADIKNINENDPLIIRAIILYAKTNFGNDPDSEKFRRMYFSQKLSLSLDKKYIGASDE